MLTGGSFFFLQRHGHDLSKSRSNSDVSVPCLRYATVLYRYWSNRLALQMIEIMTLCRFVGDVQSDVRKLQ